MKNWRFSKKYVNLEWKMMMRDLKYIAAYTVPIAVWIAIYFKGVWSFAGVVYPFVVIPVLELLLGSNNDNLTTEEIKKRAVNPVFDWMLYGNMFWVFGLLFYGFSEIHNSQLAVFEIVGLVPSLGILLATNAINVAHELGHRNNKKDQFLSQLLLLPCLYTHFFIEHNYGHHSKVATPEDPASARYNQTVYAFYWQSVLGQYWSAWSLQKKLLRNAGRSFVSFKNIVIWGAVAQIAYILLIFFVFNEFVAMLAVVIGVISFLMLESINYIEHYGLRRKKTDSGRYEKTQDKHSWNSDHVIGRIILYELTRHSDHHFKTSKKYPELNYYETSPQLPFGYPTSILLALIPPLWFRIVNPHVPDSMKNGF